MRDWTALTVKWLTGEYATIKEFGEKHNIPVGTLKKQAERYKWSINKARMVPEAREKAVSMMADRILQANEEHYKGATTIMDASLAKVNAKKDAEGKATNVNSAEQAFKIAVDVRRMVLGQPTETVIHEVEEVTDVDRAAATAIGLRLAKLRKPHKR